MSDVRVGFGSTSGATCWRSSLDYWSFIDVIETGKFPTALG
jgi:hypothetical protein